MIGAGLKLQRRTLLLGAACAAIPLGVAAQAPLTHAIRVHRDPHCGCCLAWVERMTASGRFTATVSNEADMGALKQRLGVPADLASCHTSVSEGFVFEGHVPPADAARLLRERPSGVLGLAVPGMPMGSPGMDRADGRRDAFEVIAFRANGRQTYARYAAV